MIRNNLRKTQMDLFCFGILLMLLYQIHLIKGQTNCQNPNRKSGSCISIYNCPVLIEAISDNQLSSSQTRFIQNSQCQNGVGRAPHVCCTTDSDYITTDTQLPVWGVSTPGGNRGTDSNSGSSSTNTRPATPSNGQGNILPVPPYCGNLPLSSKIYNGNNTLLDEYSWMALLQYVEKSGTRVFNCGGSLINQRYVLTAAHCVKGAIEVQVGPLTAIHLGEYDISKEIDCIGDDCNQKVVEAGIEEIIPHPDYDGDSASRYHDIALIRLNADVTYTDFIRPVCLPIDSSRSINTDEKLVVAGWGRTLLARQSNIKQHLFVPVVDQATCATKFTTRRISLISSQLCAGGEFARDSCDGDSGGPLMRQGTQNRWYLEGIVSFGNRCGLQGWPGVYTRVSDYISWIQQNIKP